MRTKSLILLILILCLVAPILGINLQIPTAIQPINVSVTGFVDSPGIYQLNITSRLSDAIHAAGKAQQTDISQVPPELSKMQLPEKVVQADSLFTQPTALRSIKLIRNDAEETFDLQLFFRTGDISQNPVLRDGDVIVLAPIREVVSLSGGVFFPGDYEFLPGDTIQKLFTLASGHKANANLSQAKLYRYKANLIDFEIIDLDLSVNQAQSWNMPLQAHDRLMIPSNSLFRRNWEVQINGHVASPGTYMIDDKTTLYDILVQAGGPTSKADLKNALMINRAMYQRENPDMSRLQLLTMGSMTPMEYNFLRTSMRQLKGKYSLDLSIAWDSKGKDANPILRDGDQIFIPEMVDMVWVSGQVRNPGLVPWIEGKDWKYYVEQAGGYTNNRRLGGIRIIRASSGNWVKPSNHTAIRSGDQIFIPESTDRDIWLDVKDIVTLVSQAITIFIGIQTVSQ